MFTKKNNERIKLGHRYVLSMQSYWRHRHISNAKKSEKLVVFLVRSRRAELKFILIIYCTSRNDQTFKNLGAQKLFFPFLQIILHMSLPPPPPSHLFKKKFEKIAAIDTILVYKSFSAVVFQRSKSQAKKNAFYRLSMVSGTK